MIRISGTEKKYSEVAYLFEAGDDILRLLVVCVCVCMCMYVVCVSVCVLGWSSKLESGVVWWYDGLIYKLISSTEIKTDATLFETSESIRSVVALCTYQPPCSLPGFRPEHKIFLSFVSLFVVLTPHRPESHDAKFCQG